MTDGESPSPEGLWCVVANIKREHAFGEGGIEAKSGTRQFRGGTKVYIGTKSRHPGFSDAQDATPTGLHNEPVTLWNPFGVRRPIRSPPGWRAS
jgi:hypothetical protein